MIGRRVFIPHTDVIPSPSACLDKKKLKFNFFPSAAGVGGRWTLDATKKKIFSAV